MVAPAGGGERRETGSLAIPKVTVKTFDMPSEFKAPWQVQWIAGGSKDGTIAFTDRTGNAVGFLNPTTGETQRNALRAITSPNGIAAIDSNRFAVAGTGGVAIFDRTPPGRITELAMAGTRNFVIATGPESRLYVPDFQNNDLRIIEAPYSGPADITKWALPSSCRGATGVIPRTNAITILCQQTNNIVDLSPTGALLRSTPLPFPNMGAQEARPAPRGAVFSGFNAGRVTGWGADYPDPYNFINVLLGRPAVSTVGHFDDPAWQTRLASASASLARNRRPTREFFFNTFTPSFGDGRFALGSFPTGTARQFANLANRNLVGSANGPGGSILVADATPGRPAIHSLFVQRQIVSKKPLFRVFPRKQFTSVDKNFLARMTVPFFGRVPPREVRANVTGASSSPWNLKATFLRNFDVILDGRGVLRNGSTYPIRVQSGDAGAFTRVYRFSGFRSNTKSLNLTLRGTNELPASFTVDAVAVPPEPCECDSLDVRLHTEPAGRTELTLGFDWTLECTGGEGACEGNLSVSGDRAARTAGVKADVVGSDKMTVERSGNEIHVTCRGDCKGPTTSGPRGAYLILKAPTGNAFGNDDIGSVTVVVERTCRRKLAPKIFRIAFGELGLVSLRRSDLNGNGVPDGQEKKK